jgi:glutathione reductase (NADPH)
MGRYDYDLITIGAGSGGVRASRLAAGYGARAAVVEERYLGGTCVNVGCIPKKLLVYASEFGLSYQEAAGFGWTMERGRFDWPRLIANKNREIERLNRVYGDLLTGAGATIIDGRAVLIDAHTVEVNGRRLTSEYLLIATGSWPSVPQVPGAEYAITSNEAFFLKELPRSVILVGGGYIAVEFAGIFHGMGVEVTELYRGPMFLRGFDDDVRAALATDMRKRGVDLRFNADVAKIEASGKGIRATLLDGATLQADLIMYATGRAPNTRNIGLEQAGIKLDGEGGIVVDGYSRSSQPNIYAVGDCTNRLMLTPVAIAEGQAVAQTLFNNKPTAIDYSIVPSAVFSQPPIGTVGLTEAQARESLGEIDVYKSDFRPLRHTLSGSEERTFMKLVVERKTDRVVGCHMVGAEAGEIIQGFAVALKCGATKSDFDATIGIHPTAAEEFVTMRNKA